MPGYTVKLIHALGYCAKNDPLTNYVPNSIAMMHEYCGHERHPIQNVCVFTNGDQSSTTNTFPFLNVASTRVLLGLHNARKVNGCPKRLEKVPNTNLYRAKFFILPDWSLRRIVVWPMQSDRSSGSSKALRISRPLPLAIIQ